MMSRREKILVAVLIFLLVTGGFYKYIYTPLYSKLDELKTNNKFLTDEIINAKKEQAKKKNLAAEADSLQAEYERLNVAIPVEPELLEAAIFIKETAKECEVNVTSLEYEPAAGGEEITAINIRVVLEGRYLPLIAFIKKMENASRFYLVENLSFSTKPAESLAAPPAGEGENGEKIQAAGAVLPFNPHLFSLDLKLRTYCERL